ncbi:MAG: hypothetical protein WC924_01165 [Candidatus Gracilibacteria bacterium]
MKSYKDYKKQHFQVVTDPKTGAIAYEIAPALQFSSGYMVHKHTFDETEGGSLTKIELFALFKPKVLLIIESVAKKLKPTSGKFNPTWEIHERPGQTILYKTHVKWNKSQVNIKAYTYAENKKKYFKLELTRQKTDGIGSRKPLEPIRALNSLGALMKLLTEDAPPIEGLAHDTFDFIDQFLEKAENHYVTYNSASQLRKLKQDKLRKNIRFGFSASQKALLSQYIIV